MTFEKRPFFPQSIPAHEFDIPLLNAADKVRKCPLSHTRERTPAQKEQDFGAFHPAPLPVTEAIFWAVKLRIRAFFHTQSQGVGFMMGI